MNFSKESLEDFSEKILRDSLKKPLEKLFGKLLSIFAEGFLKDRPQETLYECLNVLKFSWVGIYGEIFITCDKILKECGEKSQNGFKVN